MVHAVVHYYASIIIIIIMIIVIINNNNKIIVLSARRSRLGETTTLIDITIDMIYSSTVVVSVALEYDIYDDLMIIACFNFY